MAAPGARRELQPAANWDAASNAPAPADQPQNWAAPVENGHVPQHRPGGDYLQEVWQALQNHEITGMDALRALTQPPPPPTPAA
ncbi:hypothetical protein A5663_06925 [Mycobacterium sp. E740]|nr:hypothetical protein A5663_06925 [Mycobacterium sp. E740]